tara:strand:- start:7396 stop:8175 length:780 start_codon:yes stop_codon:yes gene_type:complete
MKDLLDAWSKYADRPMFEEIMPSDVDTASFRINDELEHRVWDKDDKLKPEIRQRLLEIASEAWAIMGLPTVAVDDITFTGSLANYNWSSYSDVDLHILVDFGSLPGPEDLAEVMMNAKRAAWNNKHDITIHGYEVEIYIQDSNEVHHSTGVYSVLHDSWLVKPEKKRFTIDYDNVKLKAAHIMNQIDKIENVYERGGYEEAMQDVDRLKEKIRKFRKCGLEQGGEYSSENIAFKALRRNGYLKKLSDLKTTSYDNLRSI